MATGTAEASELTREQVQTTLTTPLETAATFLAAGPRIFDTDGNPVRIPAVPNFTGSVSWVGENEQIPENDFEDDEVQLLPSTMKSLKTLTRYSNELARQSIVNLDSVLSARLVSDVAAKIDAQFLSADGDGTTTPQGMFAWTGTTPVALTGPLSIDAVLEGYGAALAANVDPSRLALFVRPADYMAARAEKDADGRYLMAPDPTTGGLVMPVLGARVFVSDRVPEGNAALVDMSQVAVARDLAPSVKILSETYGDYDQQAIRVVARYDAKPLNPAAVVVFSGITAPGAGA